MNSLGCDYGFRVSSTMASSKPQGALRVHFSQDSQQNPLLATPILQDHLLNYSALDKGLYHLKSVFVILPKTLLKGLKGSPDFTFSDTMLIAKVPYFLGGFFLAFSPFIGKNYREGIRQSAAVATYLLGAIASSAVINSLYKWRYGVDLTMMYRTKDGNVDQVFASHDFARFDLLKPHHYIPMIRKMNIPPSINDPEGAVKDNVRHIIASSRALKLVVGNLVSVVGAGYIARSKAWLKLPAVLQAIKGVWRTPNFGLFQKLSQTLRPLSDLGASLIDDRVNLTKINTRESLVVLSTMAGLAGTVLYIFSSLGKTKKEYAIPAQRMLGGKSNG